MPIQIGLNNIEDKTIMLVLIDIIIFLAWFFNIILSIVIFAFLRVIPFSLIYIVNASPLILQDKLNNIWKKADAI